MNKIEFYKNDQIVDINISELLIDFDNNIITKENEESIIILDFNKKSCLFELKDNNLQVDIPCKQMHHICYETHEIFEYILISEPDIRNRIIVYKK